MGYKVKIVINKKLYFKNGEVLMTRSRNHTQEGMEKVQLKQNTKFSTL